MTGKRIKYILSAVLYAYGFYFITAMFFMHVADYDPLISTSINILLIFFFLIVDEIEEKVQKRLVKKYENRELIPRSTRALMAYLTGAKFKSAMYLFYIVIIISNALVTAGSQIHILVNHQAYFQTIQPGILILIAADKLMDQIFKDIRVDDRMMKDFTKDKKNKKS